MKVVIDAGGFVSDMMVCDHQTAMQLMALLPKLRPVKREYDKGYFYTLQGKRQHETTFTCVNDDTIRLPIDLKDLVEVKRAEAELVTIADTGLDTEASKTDTGEVPF